LAVEQPLSVPLVSRAAGMEVAMALLKVVW
jgi:hypothetical protein